MEWLNLQKEEKIISEYKPEMILWLFASIFGRIIVALLITAFIAIITKTSDVVFLAVLFVLFLLIQFIMSYMAYTHAYYVVTNKRLMQKKGFIGYSVTSVSYNRLADIIVRHSMMEKVFGVGSLLVQTLAGQVSSGARGAEIMFLYLKDPEKVQKEIYKASGK